MKKSQGTLPKTCHDTSRPLMEICPELLTWRYRLPPSAATQRQDDELGSRGTWVAAVNYESVWSERWRVSRVCDNMDNSQIVQMAFVIVHTTWPCSLLPLSFVSRRQKALFSFRGEICEPQLSDQHLVLFYASEGKLLSGSFAFVTLDPLRRRSRIRTTI